MRTIKFRAWDIKGKTWVEAQSRFAVGFWGEPIDLYFPDNAYNLVLEQYTGLNDKNGLAELYEGDIIDGEGNLKGNIHESPQIYEAGVDCLIEEMGTSRWSNTEKEATRRGCRYAE